MPNLKLKFNIDFQLSLLPREISLTDVEGQLLKYKISPSTFYRDRFIEASTDYSIPVDRLNVYAMLFGCHLTELITEYPKGKSLRALFNIVKVQQLK